MFFFAKIIAISLILYTDNLGTAIWAVAKSMKPASETASFHKSCRPAVTTLYLLRSSVETAENSCGNNC